MLKARDPQSGLMVEPNPKARAKCQFCGAVVVAKCGEIVGWHWSHLAAQSCEEWANAERKEREDALAREKRASLPPRRVCTSCIEWFSGCESSEPLARAWLSAWGNTEGGTVWLYRGAPQCPAWRWAKPFKPGHDQNPSESQWRDR